MVGPVVGRFGTRLARHNSMIGRAHEVGSVAQYCGEEERGNKSGRIGESGSQCCWSWSMYKCTHTDYHGLGRGLALQ